MAFFESDKKAWHDATATLQKEGEGTGGAGGLHFNEIYRAELAKVLHAINRLPKQQRLIGMMVYGSPYSLSHQDINRAEQLVWAHWMSQQGDDFLRSYRETTRVIILCRQVLPEVQAKVLRNQSLRSHRELADDLAIDKSTFSRNWRHMWTEVVGDFMDMANAAMVPITSVVHEVNAKYRDAA